jgi:hypothetical protein
MENLIDVGINLVLSMAGLTIYSLVSVSQHLKLFNLKKFFNDNKPFWIWAFSLQFIFALLITYLPDTSTAIKSLSGLDLSESMAFLTSGLGLSKLANWATGKTVSESSKIGNKPL